MIEVASTGDDNRGLHIGMDLAVLAERAGLLKSETVGPS